MSKLASKIPFKFRSADDCPSFFDHTPTPPGYIQWVPKKGLTGAEPEAVCHWAFEIAAARPEDELFDLFPGTGAVTEAWRTWRGKFTLPADAAA